MAASVPEEPQPLGAVAITRTHFQEILAEADTRCFHGKGAERHAATHDAPFSEHDFFTLFKRSGSGGPQFQIEKKIAEYRRTGDRMELVDCIVYLTAMLCEHDSHPERQW